MSAPELRAVTATGVVCNDSEALRAVTTISSRPGAVSAACWARTGAEETSNEMLSLDTFLGVQGNELEEKMMLAPDNKTRAGILNTFLEDKLLTARLKGSTIAASIKHVLHSPGIASVEQLAYHFNLSPRQFNRKFKEYAGFSPKLYMRLSRLSRAIKGHKTDKPLTRIAYECGYYDQSHFIHDVKAFTGYHPGFYFSGKAEGTEYLYI